MRFQQFSLPALAVGSLAQVTQTIVSLNPSGEPTTTVETGYGASGQASVSTTVTLGAEGSATPLSSAPGIVDVVSSNDQLSTLLSVLQQDRFSELLQRLTSPDASFTCLAPTNDAFAAFLETENGQRFQDDDEYATALLEYHVMLGVIDAAGFMGEGLLGSEWYRTFYYRPSATPDVDARVGGYTDADGAVKIVGGYLDTATVQQADVEFTGGYVHVIDTVLTVPPSLEELLVTGDFTSLMGAFSLAENAGLGISAAQALDQPTIFAPTNQAFENIGSALGSLSAQDVANILMYHVVEAPAFASDLSDGQELQTLGGGSLTVTIREGDDGPMVFINGARVVLPDLALLEGVVHGIDQVLNPDNMMMPSEGAMAGVPQYEGAEAVDSPPLTSGLPSPTTTVMMPDAMAQPTASQSYMPEQQTGAAVTAAKVPGALLLGAGIVGLAF